MSDFSSVVSLLSFLSEKLIPSFCSSKMYFYISCGDSFSELYLYSKNEVVQVETKLITNLIEKLSDSHNSSLFWDENESNQIKENFFIAKNIENNLFLLSKYSDKGKFFIFGDYSNENNSQNEYFIKIILDFTSHHLNNLIYNKEYDYSREESKRLVFINQITQKIIGNLDIEEVTNILIDSLSYNLDFDRVFLILKNNLTNTFDVTIGNFESKEKIEINEFYQESEKNQEYDFLNFLKNSYLLSSITDKETFWGIPILFKDKQIGFLGVDNYRNHKLLDIQSKELIRMVVSQISSSLENARLYNDIKQNALGFKHLFEITSSLFDTSLDYNESAKTIIDKLAASISVSKGYLISFNANKYHKIIASVENNSNLLDTKAEITPPIKQAIMTNQPVLYDYTKNPRFKCIDLKFALIVPMYIKDRLLGIICLGESSENQNKYFTKHEIKLVQTIVNQASITLENALLYNKLEEMVVEKTFDLIESNQKLKTQKEEFEILSERLQSIITGIPDGIVVINHKDKIVNYNPAFEKVIKIIDSDNVLKISEGVSISQLIEKFEHTDSKNINYLKELVLFIDNDKVETLKEFVIKSDRNYYYKLSKAEVIEKYEDSSIENKNKIIVFHDFTKEKEIEKMKSDFMAVVSHELKTPVSAMMGFAALIEDGLVGDITLEQEEYLKKIQLQGERLIRLINDLLDFSKLESGQMPTFIQLLDPIECVVEIVEMLRNLADEKNLQLSYSYDGDIAPVYADQDKFKQILINLISNAIKFTPENTGIVEVNIKEIENDEILFTVKDNGIGIHDKDKEKLFESFYQADNTSTRKFGGTGLGLAIVKKLSTLNKGRVWFESELNKGSTFYFTLPTVKK
jgi:signal transduction histidine kinase